MALTPGRLKTGGKVQLRSRNNNTFLQRRDGRKPGERHPEAAGKKIRFGYMTPRRASLRSATLADLSFLIRPNFFEGRIRTIHC
jgi:hypothetical protein